VHVGITVSFELVSSQHSLCLVSAQARSS